MWAPPFDKLLMLQEQIVRPFTTTFSRGIPFNAEVLSTFFEHSTAPQFGPFICPRYA
jgi:hypothetical protein